MSSRFPSARPLANSTSPVALMIQRAGSISVIEFRPWAVITAGTLTALLLAWYLVATVYFIFRDEMLGKLMSQQTEMQYAYEDRIAALRNQIDRLASRQLLDQDTVEGKVHELVARQAQLENRQAMVATLLDQPAFAGLRQQARAAGNAPAPATTGSLGVARPGLPAGASAFSPGLRPNPAEEAFQQRAPVPTPLGAAGGPDRPTPLPSPVPERRSDAGAPVPLASRLGEARATADRLATRQNLTLDLMERSLRQQQARMTGALADTGIDIGRFPQPRAGSGGQGGPLVPLPEARDPGTFEFRLVRLQTQIAQAERLRRVLGQLPIHRPMTGDFDITSGYGSRSDPFTRGLAMHTGIDFRAPTGTGVRAAAPGKVVEAGWLGGYGQMVEIDHGGGIATRYAHLSSIDVDVGDTVARGELIGRVGSTGRSTGPHLHYEVRIDGDAVDPMRFIRAGQKVAER
jgi:murein DD-endopeptidase MepM/ murein hydrolase activator NlpD